MLPFIDDIENVAVSIPTLYTNFLTNHVREALTRLAHPLLDPYDLNPRDFIAISAYESGFCMFGSITPSEHCGPNLKGRWNENYPSTLFLVIEYDNDVLALSSVIVSEGATLFRITHALLSMSADVGGNASMNWEEVTQWIATNIGSHRVLPNNTKFNRLVLVGQRTADSEFEKAIWTALRLEIYMVDISKLEADAASRLDPEFVTALGVAQIAKDWRDAPQPIGCSEDDACKQRRREISDESSMRLPVREKAKGEL